MKNDHLDVARMRGDLLEAIKPDVPFDGWSEPAFARAVGELGVDPGVARLVCPRGAVDLAVEYHRAADRAAAQLIGAADWPQMRFRDKVCAAVRMRLELGDPELVRRAAALFALPHLAPTGAKLIWESADAIWTALGDTSRDVNWYSKRMTLSAVYSATVLFWMGDESEGRTETWEFLERRIDDVMQIEKVKGRITGLPGLSGILARIRAPEPRPMPGRSAP